MSGSLVRQSWLIIVTLLASATARATNIELRADEQFRPWKAAGESLCSMTNQRAAIVGDQIFFMNGNYNFIGDTTRAPKPNLFTLRLNESFSVTGLLTDQLYSSDLPSDVPWDSASGAFFYDNTTLYLYAGLPSSDESATNRLWAYNVMDSLWREVIVKGGNYQHGSRETALYASIPGAGLSFFSGGKEGDTPGIIRFNSSNPAALTWENDTSFSYSNPKSPGPLRSEGQLVFVPVGEQGVLISIGGYNVAEKGFEYGDKFPWDDAPMSSVDVYDIASRQWYTVDTSGSAPHDRGIFSYWMTPAPDGSSYTITVYGGWSLLAGKSYEDIYVLSLPSFTWIKIVDIGNIERENMGEGLGRLRHRGLKWREDSGFVIGGWIKNNAASINEKENCNSIYSPIRLLNLTSYAWLSSYDPNNTSPYRVNPQIYTVIGGGPSGSATVTAPSGGWSSNTALEAIFSRHFNVPSAPTNLFAQAAVTGGSNPVNSSSSPAETSSQSSSSTSGGVIAGAVVGAVAGTALIAGGMAFFCLRKYKLQRQQQSSAVSLMSKEGGSSALSNKQHPQELENEVMRHELDTSDGRPVELQDTGRRELADSSNV